MPKKSVEEHLLGMVEDWRDIDPNDFRWFTGYRWSQRLVDRQDVLTCLANHLEEFVHTHPELKDLEI